MGGSLLGSLPLPRGTPWELEAEGVRVRAMVRRSPRASQTLILLPPLGEGWSTWRRLWPALAELGACIAIETPELADSNPAATALPVGLQVWSRALRGLIDQAGEHPVFLIGASMGGMCALRAASEMPGRVSGVVCLGLRPDLGRLSFLRSLFDVKTSEDVVRLLKATWVDPPELGEAALARLMATLQSQEVKSQIEIVAGLNVRHETEQAVRAGVQVTFISGANDGLLAAGEIDPGTLPSGIEHHVLDRCGHYPHQQQWELCARLIAGAVVGETALQHTQRRELIEGVTRHATIGA